ncbi:hypothetical protein V5735_01555 (plasmid) [Haladaptatus sp. SPP-AMP-3]|uniref:hypothetical protein n=1 Tax=Haladaptatus sp. SPP-AMP-3 TaxID=3121295 RepID=UPI003C2F1FD0
MSTINNLENRVEQLEGEYNSGGGGMEIIITHHRVGQDGDSEPVEENRIWEDSTGWHSETTELADDVDPEDHDWGVS